MIELFIIAFLIIAIGVYLLELRKESRELKVVGVETKATDHELRKQVVETQILAFTHLAGADDVLKRQVAAIIADAAMHLGYPYLNGRLLNPPGTVLSWNKEGLSKIAQARQLVDDYIASSKPAAVQHS